MVLLTGASGSMGFEAFRLLWEKRDRYEIVLLLRPSPKNKRLFSPYVRQAGNLKIVWGDALNREDIIEACRGIDWCLHCMAMISPAADRDPDRANLVNMRATQWIVEAIEAQDPGRIRMVYIGSVAMYGDRRPPFHTGRTGDPLLPSTFDHYAISKIRGELAVMESSIRHRASLRQTFIMIPRLFSLMDPIMFHQPIDSFMENITARDAGRALVACLELGDESDFWGGFYNLSGGPSCRTTFLEFLERIYRLLGMDYRRVMERRWFVLKNFHMQYFEDAHILDRYLHHWNGGQTLEDYYRQVWRSFHPSLRAVAWLNRRLPPFRRLVELATRLQLRSLALQKGGTLRWIRENDRSMIAAFYGSVEEFLAIPGWDTGMPDLDHGQEFRRLDHGYDESKNGLAIEDLRKAAECRGGTLVSDHWDGDLCQQLAWQCKGGHHFSMSPNSVLRGGHWCQECLTFPLYPGSRGT